MSFSSCAATCSRRLAAVLTRSRFQGLSSSGINDTWGKSSDSFGFEIPKSPLAAVSVRAESPIRGDRESYHRLRARPCRIGKDVRNSGRIGGGAERSGAEDAREGGCPDLVLREDQAQVRDPRVTRQSFTDEIPEIRVDRKVASFEEVFLGELREISDHAAAFHGAAHREGDASMPMV